MYIHEIKTYIAFLFKKIGGDSLHLSCLSGTLVGLSCLLLGRRGVNNCGGVAKGRPFLIFSSIFRRDPTLWRPEEATKDISGTKTNIFEKFERFCVQWYHFQSEITIISMFNIFIKVSNSVGYCSPLFPLLN